MSDENVWRCFHCGEVCRSEVDARNHFGSTQGSEPACSIKAAGEFALLQALRNAEDRLQRYAAEDSDVLRAMYSMQSDHQQALRREEESGYAKGVADMRAESQKLRAVIEWCLSNHAGHLYEKQNWNDADGRYDYAWKIQVGSGNSVPEEFSDIIKPHQEPKP